MSKRKPNVLLITTDQQRRDSIGVFGGKIAATPNIDKLASDGVAFSRAFAQNPVCVPSRACIQTGRYTHQHKVTYMENAVDDTPGLPDHEKTFWEYLRDDGYKTAAFGKIHMYPEKGFDETGLTGGKGGRWTQSTGLPIGPGPLGPEYEKWLEERHPGGYELIYEQRRGPEYKKYNTAIENILPLEEYVDYWIADNTIKCIENHKDEPFFIWCGFCGPHGPIDPPKPYSHMYRIEDMPLPLYYDRISSDKRPSEYIAKRFTAYYFGLVTLIDDMVGSIVRRLKDNGIYDDTIIIYTTDHGEMMGDFGKYGKGNFYDTTIRIPLIIKPAAESLLNVKMFDGLTEHIDIAPTILDYTGLPVPKNIQGISLRGIIEGRSGGKDNILSEHTTNEQDSHGICLRDGRFKFWYWTNPDRIVLFDTLEDPDETINLADDIRYKDVIDRMKTTILAKLMESMK